MPDQLRRDPATVTLEAKLAAIAVRARAAVDLLFGMYWSPQDWADRWAQTGPATLGQIRGLTVRATVEVTADYLDGYGYGVAADYRPSSGRVYSWAELSADAVTRARARMESQGLSLDEAMAVEHRTWRGRAEGEPARVSRQAVADNATRWQRIAEPGACAFCRMLASRGAAYYSAESAGEGLRYHDRCRCTAQPVTSGDDERRLRAEGREEWRRMTAAGDVPTIRGQRASTWADPDRYMAGADTLERRRSIQLQLEQLRGRRETEWSRGRVAELTAELARFGV